MISASQDDSFKLSYGFFFIKSKFRNVLGLLYLVFVSQIKKIHFWDIFGPKKSCESRPLILPRRDALFEYSYHYILSFNFFTEKVGNGSKLKKIVIIVLMTYFITSVLTLNFDCCIRKLVILSVFLIMCSIKLSKKN